MTSYCEYCEILVSSSIVLLSVLPNTNVLSGDGYNAALILTGFTVILEINLD